MKCITLLFILINPTAVLFGQQSLEQRIKIVEQVMVYPDSNILNDLAHKDLVYVHSSGTTRDKTGFINEFMTRQTNVTSAQFIDQTISYSGKKLAIVKHRLLADSVKEGYPPKIDVITLEVWIKEKKKWKILSRQAAKIPG